MGLLVQNIIGLWIDIALGNILRALYVCIIYVCIFIVIYTYTIQIVVNTLNKNDSIQSFRWFVLLPSIILRSGASAYIVELLSGDSLQKSMKDFYTKPKLELHSERL